MKLPTEWSEVTLKQYQEVIELSTVDMDELDKQIKIISILSGEREDKISDLSIPTIKKCIKATSFIYAIPGKGRIRQSVKLAGKRYQINYYVNKLSGGEYIDLTGYLKDANNTNSNLHYIVSIFMHPLNWFGLIDKKCYTKNAKGEYCQKLESRNKTAELVKDMPMDVVFGMSGFFLNLWEHLIETTNHYLIKEVKKKNMEVLKKLDSLIIGDGTIR